MSGKKKVLMVLLVLLIMVTVVAGLWWHMTHYIMIDLRFYPKNAKYLDLRGEDISIKHYEKIGRRIPGCQIEWDVPFQDTAYPDDTKEITITSLTANDVETLDYLTQLEKVHAQGCTDYTQLLALEERRPELAIDYGVTLGENTYSRDAAKVELVGITPAEVSFLRCLPGLESVVCGANDADTAAAVREYCHANGQTFQLCVAGQTIPEDAKKVTAEGITDGELNLLRFLTDVEELELPKPEAAAEALIRLREDFPQVKITWEQEICGVRCSSEEKELNLSEAKLKKETQLDEVAEMMAYFPDMETVFLGSCEIKNETLAKYRDQVRDSYKLVWNVKCGDKLTVRTDATTFMPVREGVYYFFDEDAENLRYCEDMVCIDIGHMSVSKVDFVKYMPDLEYLVLAHTQVQYIEPIKNCKKLKFLELDWSPIKDYSPLVECKALEDLNLGNTYADFEPIGTMTWLKNLWMIGCSRGPAYRMTQALTETKVMVSGSATVANGWRDLDNYYKMRDLLGMEYMEW